MKTLKKLLFLSTFLFLTIHDIWAMENSREEEDKQSLHHSQPLPLYLQQLRIHPSVRSNELNISYSDKDYFIDEQRLDVPTLRANLLKRNPEKVTLSWVGLADLEISSPEECPPHIAAVNAILLEFREGETLRDLTLSGYFNNDSIALIGQISHLKHLDFIENRTFISCDDYSPLKRLTKLEELDLRTTGFAEEKSVQTRFALNDKRDIKLKGFLLILPHLTKLQVLNIGNNYLFPEDCKDNAFGGPKRGLTTRTNYEAWRQSQIEECTHILVTSFHGKELMMRDTRLGLCFISAFESDLGSFQLSHQGIKLDFSENFIPLSCATSYVIALNELRLPISVDFSENEGYNLDELRDEILASLLAHVTLK
ncbi:MAG: hypothetical protein BGO67_02760 [Alphaproteobacteria bacterium 41-28]|nr:MAG: hypothetical protein BGO67_02760 [Alphaproteobacteria bacterium 41-28]